MSPGEMFELAVKFLAGGLLDVNWAFWKGWGLYKGERIGKLLDETFGDRVMRETNIPLYVFACDAETGDTVCFSTLGTPHIRIADAVRASLTIPLLFRLFSLRGKNYWDGGMTMNFAMDLFDDKPARPTVGLRFRGKQKKRKLKSLFDVVLALVGVWLRAANNGHISSKHFAKFVTIDTDGDALDFTLSRAQIEALYHDGWTAAQAQVTS
jgi:NTE family protein